MRRLGLRQPTKAQGIHSEGKRPVDLQSLDVQNSELSKGQNEQHTTKDSASMATENTVKHRTAHRATVDLRIAGLLDGLDDDSFFGDDMIIANEPSTGVDKNTTIEANTGIIAYTAIRLNPTHSINTEKDMGAKLDRRKVGGINSAEYQQSENSNVDVMTTEDEKNAQYMDTHVGTDDAGDRAANIDRELMNMCAPVSIGTNNNLSGENGYCATDSRNSHSAVHPGMKRNVEYGFGVANNLINHSTHDAAPGHGGNDSHSAVFTHTVNTHSVLSGGKGVLTGRATDASAVCQQNEANKLTATVASSFGRQETAPIPHELQEARKGPKVNEEMQRVPSVSPNGQRGTDSLHEVYIGGQRSVACILRRPSDDLVDPQIEEHSQVSQAQYGMTEDLSPERQRLSVEKGQTPVASGDRLNISYWVSKKAASAYQAYANVVQMFEWQAECMAYAVEGLKKGRGIVYSAPTSGGKTLVAELLLIRRILTTKKKCLFIVPYNSIVVEKSAHFVKLFKTLNLVVYNYGGPQNTFTFERADLIVCTAEKANGICNKLIAEHKMHTLGMVVVDELHMVADDKRGSILEMLMIKIMAAKAGMGHSIPTTQISTQASTQMQTQTQIHTQMQSQSSYMMNMTQAGLAQTQEQFLKGTQNCTPNNGDTRCSIQVVAMSATLSNLKVLAEWLDAEMYVTSFRPVELVQYFKFGRGIYDTEGKFVRDFLQTAPDDPKPDFLVEKQDSTKYEYKHAAVDQSGLAPLCWETVKSGHSVLIFCQTRKFCQNSARLVNNCMPSALQTDEREALVDLVSRYKQIPTGWDKELVPLMLNGIAYHHSGLTLDERELVEEGFRRNIIKVLTATTTLSSGVNLPARRVIFRTIMQSRWNVTKVMYNQMKGRAGRTGKDDMGESIIICKDRNEKQMAIELMGTAIPPVKSALGNLSVKSLTNPSASSSDRSGPKSEATDSKSEMETADPAFTNGQLARISQALLEGVVGGMVADLDDATCYMGFSLLQYFEDAQKLRQATLEALDILVQSRFVTVEWKSGHTQAREGLSKSPNILPNTAAIPIVGGDRITRTNMSMKSNEETNPPAQPYISMQVYATGGEGMSLQSTHLGRACVASALAPGESHLVFKDLDNATKALALETELQLCYLVAPPYNMYSTEQQHNKWQALVTALGVPNNQVYLRVLHNIGINPDSLIRWSQRGESAAEKRDPSEELARARRLYIAYAMSMIVKEEPIANISRWLGVDRGSVQSLQELSSSFSGMVAVFCSKLGWEHLASLFKKLPARLSFGVTQELYKLTSIPGINGADARALYNHGYKDLRDIASARPKAIADVLWNAKPFRTDSSVSETQVQRLPKHIENEKKRLLVRAGQMQKAANQHFAAELEIISQPNGPRDKTPTPLRMESSLQSRTSWIKPTPVQRQLPGATPSNNRSGVGKSETGVSENRNTAPKQRAEFTPPFPSMRSRTITPAQTPALSWARAQQLTQPHTQALTKSHVQTHTHRHVQIQTPVRRREEGYSNLKQQVNTQSSENTPIQWIGQRTPMGTQTPASMQSLTQRHVQAQTPMYSKPWVKGLSPDTDDHENSTMSLRTQATNVQHMHEHPTQYTQHAPTQHTHTRHTHPPPPVYQVQHGTKRSIGDTQRLDDIGSVGASGNYGTELDHRILDGHTRKRSKVDHSEQVSDPHTMAEHGLNLETTSNLLEEHRGYHGMDGVVETLSKQQQPQIQQHIHLGEQPVPYEKQHTVSRETQQERQRALSQQGQSNSNQQESRLEQHNLEGRPQPLPSGHRQEQKGKDGEQLRQQNLDVQHQSQIGMQHQQKCSSSMLPQSKHNSMKHQQTNHSIQNQQNNYCMPHQQSRQPYEQQHQQQQRQQQTRANPEHQEMSTLQLNHQAQLQRAKKQREKEARLQLQRQRKIEQQRYNLASMAQQNAPENLASTATVENSTRPSKSLNPSKDSARDATRSAAATSTGMDRAGATHANVAIETRSGHPRIAEFDKKEASMSTIVHNNANSSSGVVVKESGGTLNDAQKTQESGAKRVATANATAVVAKQHVEKKPSSGSEAVMRVVMVVQVMTSDASFREFERTWRSKSKFCICGTYTAAKSSGGASKPRLKDLSGLSVCFDASVVWYMDFTNPEVRRSDLKIDSEVPSYEDGMRLLKEQLVRTDTNLIFVSAKRFLKALRCHGYEPGGNISDPLIADWLLSPSTDYKSPFETLSPCLPLCKWSVRDHTSTKPAATDRSKEPNRVSNKMPIKDPPLDTRVVECAKECLVGWEVMPILSQKLHRHTMDTLFTKIEMPVVRLVADLEARGFPVITETLRKMVSATAERMCRLSSITQIIAKTEFSLESPIQVAKALFDNAVVKCTYPDFLNTSKTRKSTNRRVLRWCANQSDSNIIFSLMIEWRSLQHLSATLLSLLRSVGDSDALMATYSGSSPRLHSNGFLRTATGRIIFAEPNLQNLPRSIDLCDVDQLERLHPSRDDDAALAMPAPAEVPKNVELLNVRLAFGYPSEAQMLLIAADYSQLELRVVAHLSQDVPLLAFLRQGDDLFEIIARRWLVLGTEATITHTQRQQAKQLCYGVIYGMGPSAVAGELAVDVAEAQKHITAFQSMFPGLARYTSETIKQAKKKGYASTLLKRRRWLPELNSKDPIKRSHAERQALNSTIQGSAADIVKLAMTAVQTAVKKGWQLGNRPSLIMQIHDELIYETPVLEAERFRICLRGEMEKMEKVYQFSVALLVKISTGSTWGSLSRIQ